MSKNSSTSIKHKQLSSEAFWEKIEETYGVVPEFIKKILQINGFDSYLALKGIRYDDKSEFFNSLEATVREIFTSDEMSADKMELYELLRGCELKNFKLKPGHRNFIMNLMREIDNSDANEFFKNVQGVESSSNVAMIKIPHISPNPVDIKYQIENDTNCQDEEEFFQQDEQTYIEEQSEEIIEKCEDEEYLLEEYLSDEHRSMEGIDMDGYVIEVPQLKRARTKSAIKRHYRKPERMYNEEFLSKNSNPRRRRVTTTKVYPATDEGTQERFKDLMIQSMRCILTQDQLSAVEDVPIDVKKQSESCWSVQCPLCQAGIKLAVVYENNGKYVNYKRSNFERHLRFKHCKTPRQPIKQLFESTILPSSPSSITKSSLKFNPCSLKIENN